MGIIILIICGFVITSLLMGDISSDDIDRTTPQDPRE